MSFDEVNHARPLSYPFKGALIIIGKFIVVVRAVIIPFVKQVEFTYLDDRIAILSFIERLRFLSDDFAGQNNSTVLKMLR